MKAKWTEENEQDFHSLAVEEALRIITPKSLKYLERLSRKRQRCLYPPTKKQLAYWRAQYKRLDKMMKNILRAVDKEARRKAKL